MTEPQKAGPLAWGGLLLSGFGLFGAAAVLLIYLAAPNAVLLVMEALFALMALAGGVIGGLGIARGGRSRPVGAATVAATAAVWLGVVPATVHFGLPRFRAFQMDSREAQALHNLDRLKMGAISHHHMDGTWPKGDTGWVPEAPLSDRRYTVVTSHWQGPPWTDFDFVPAAAHFHQYRVLALPSGQGVDIMARGDLDGDGAFAITTLRVETDSNGRIVTSPAERLPTEEH